MDPNETLKQLRALVIQERDTRDLTDASATRATLAELADLAGELGELFDALDTWLANGGFLPANWNKRR